MRVLVTTLFPRVLHSEVGLEPTHAQGGKEIDLRQTVAPVFPPVFGEPPGVVLCAPD